MAHICDTCLRFYYKRSHVKNIFFQHTILHLYALYIYLYSYMPLISTKSFLFTVAYLSRENGYGIIIKNVKTKIKVLPSKWNYDINIDDT